MPISQEVLNLTQALEVEYQSYSTYWWWRLYRALFYPGAIRLVIENKLNGAYQETPQAYYLDLFKALSQANWWFQRNLFPGLRALFSHPLREAVEALNEAGLLRNEQAQANFDAVAEHQIPLAVSSALRTLNAVGLLTGEQAQTNRDLVAGHVLPQGIAWALGHLNAAGLLSGAQAQANRDAVAGHQRPFDLSLVLRELEVAGLLTGEQGQANFNAVMRQPAPGFYSLLDRLHCSGLLGEEGQGQPLFDLVIAHTALLFAEPVNQVWAHVPPHARLTAEQFNAMMAICQDPTQPIEARQTQLEIYIIRHLVGIVPDGHRARTVNDNQSTHTASVHKSVSASAVKLKDRYGASLQGQALDVALKELSAYIRQLPDDSIQNTAAKRCLARLKGYGYGHGFKDEVSDITTKQLLALSWRAIHDKENRKGDLTDAKARLVQGLYEIQRGYNLSEQGVDDGLDDRPICQSGTFNKLIEPLVGTCLDADILYITKAHAASKLPIVVKEEAKRFLAAKVGADNSSEHQEAADLINEINDANGCIEPLWAHIQAQAAARMFDEFGSLYPEGAEGDAFKEFIEGGGPWVVLEEDVLDGYKKQLACSVMPKSEEGQTDASSVTTVMTSSSRFFKPETAADDCESAWNSASASTPVSASASESSDVRLASQ